MNTLPSAGIRIGATPSVRLSSSISESRSRHDAPAVLAEPYFALGAATQGEGAATCGSGASQPTRHAWRGRSKLLVTFETRVSGNTGNEIFRSVTSRRRPNAADGAGLRADAAVAVVRGVDRRGRQAALTLSKASPPDRRSQLTGCRVHGACVRDADWWWSQMAQPLASAPSRWRCRAVAGPATRSETSMTTSTRAVTRSLGSTAPSSCVATPRAG